MTEKKKRKRKTKAERKLSRAIDTLASIIETKASAMLESMEGDDNTVEIKQIKELTGAVKELSALICQSSPQAESPGAFAVIFEGEGEEWAK